MSNDIDQLRNLTKEVLDQEKAKTFVLKKLSEKTKELQLLIDASNDGVWDWNINDDYEYMSPRFWEIFGYEPHEKPHHPSAWQSMIHPDDFPVAAKGISDHHLSKGEIPFKVKVRYKHKKGHWVTVLCRGEVIEWNDDGTAKRMIGTHTDMTDVTDVTADS